MTKNKKIYVVEMRAFSGTVMLLNNITAFATKELAEKTAEKLKEVNKDVRVQTKEVYYYESEQDVPILNNEANN